MVYISEADWISGPKGHTLASYCSGHLALLDFFTYCCINCQHVLPDLYDLEQLYTPQDGLVVVFNFSKHVCLKFHKN